MEFEETEIFNSVKPLVPNTKRNCPSLHLHEKNNCSSLEYDDLVMETCVER